MKRLIPLLLAFLLLTTAACGADGAAPSASPTASPAPEEQTYTGILEENKGFMITVAPENKDNDSMSYVFGTDGVTVDAKVGDKVTVTYTGNINDLEGTLEASKVEPAK